MSYIGLFVIFTLTVATRGESSFRLVDASGDDITWEEEGLLLYEGGTVCDDMFSVASSNAICKDMGFEAASSWRTGYDWKSLQKSFDIKLDNVKCPDSEWSSCTYTANDHNCGHSEDVFLLCRGNTCPAGSYRNASLCEKCPSNTYQAHESSKSSCQSCPISSTSDPGSTQCYCKAGRYWSDGVCRICPKSSVSRKGALLCSKCPSTSKAINDGSSCSCPVGQEWVWEEQTNGLCKPCMPGTYKSTLTSACEICPAGSTSSVSSEHCSCPAGKFWAENSCQLCDQGSVSLEGALQCQICSSGHQTDGSKCHCLEGWEWVWNGQTEASCKPCMPGAYKDNQMTSCALCPTGGTSEAGSANCTCKAGLFWTGEKCESCGKVGVSREGSPDCIYCPEGSTPVNEGSWCSCPAGREWSWEENSSGSCIPCSPGTYKSEEMKFCGICPSGTTSLVGSEHCMCPAGQFWNESSCKGCSHGYVSQEGALKCQLCPVKSTAIDGGSACSCPAGELWGWDEHRTGRCKLIAEYRDSALSLSKTFVPVIVVGVLAVTCFILTLLLIVIFARQMRAANKGKPSKATYERFDSSFSLVNDPGAETIEVVLPVRSDNDGNVSIYQPEEGIYSILGEVGESSMINKAEDCEDVSTRSYETCSKKESHDGRFDEVCSGFENEAYCEGASANIYNSLSTEQRIEYQNAVQHST